MDVSANQDTFYEHLGAALYQSQALEFSLINLYAETLRKRESLWTQRLQTLMGERRSNHVLRLLEEVMLDLDLPALFLPRLHQALMTRCWLLHHSYFELAGAAYDESLAATAVARLDEVAVSLATLVLDLNEMLFDRQLDSAQDGCRARADRSILQYMEKVELF